MSLQRIEQLKRDKWVEEFTLKMLEPTQEELAKIMAIRNKIFSLEKRIDWEEKCLAKSLLYADGRRTSETGGGEPKQL